MKLPLFWIKKHLPLSETPIEMGEKWTKLGLEVDKISEEGRETIFEISLTPNLGHALSLIGATRELAAVVEAPFKPLSVQHIQARGNLSPGFQFKVDPSVSLYSARRVKGVKNGESPAWLIKVLQQCDLQPIDLIVDVMNYVMMEMGQPLHAFDGAKISGIIEVRFAKKGESFLGLDGKTYMLDNHHLVIADQDKILALAGVMGGESSKVTASTTEVVIEAALFPPTVIRKQSRELGISTESSRRFERGIDQLNVIKGLDRAIMLIEELSKPDSISEIVQVENKPYQTKVIPCRLSRIEAMLGLHLGVEQINAIWSKLGMEAKWNGKDLFEVTIPSFRNDVNEEIDLIEEVARVYGLDNLPKKEAKFSLSTIPHAPLFLFEQKTRKTFLRLGLQEWMCCDLIDPKKLEMLFSKDELPGKTISILNPSSEELSVLRPSLLPGMLLSAKQNIDHGNELLEAFEMGKIHFQDKGLPKEELMGAILIKDETVDFFDLKGHLEAFLEGMDVQVPSYKNENRPFFHPGRQASIYLDEAPIGIFGEVHPAISKKLDILKPILALEINLQELHRFQKPREKMDPLPEFPASTRDWTATLPRSLAYQVIKDKIEAARPPHLENFRLKDIFRSEKLGSDLQNVTLHFVYRGKKETLTQEVVDKEHLGLIDQLTKALVVT